MAKPALRFAAFVLFAAGIVVSARAVQYIQDEYLWTKGTWREFKLKFPLQHFGSNQPADDPSRGDPAAAGAAEAAEANRTVHGEAASQGDVYSAARQRLPAEVSTHELEAALEAYEGVSLGGAVPATSGGGSPHTGAKASTGPPMRIIETDASVPKAAAVIECQVCAHFAEEAWKGLVQWLLGGPGQRLSRQRLIKYLPEICHWEVPQVFLREHVIMEGVPQQGRVAAIPDTAFVGRRHEEVTKIQELRTVRAACSSILKPLKDAYPGAIDASASTTGPGEATASAAGPSSAKQDADAMIQAFMTALDAMVLELEKIPGLGYKKGRDNGMVESENVDDGPVLQDSCQDHHPGCINWAKWGECSRNSKYMLGADEWPGNCKLSCGACSPPAHVRNRFLSEQTSAALLAAAESLVSKLERRLCSEARPCQRKVAQLLQREFANMRIAARGGNAFAVDEHGAQLPLPPTRWPASRVALVRRASEALTGRPEAPAALPEDVREASPAEQALARALHDRCLYADAGWWAYELCWQRHLRQFHAPELDAEQKLETVNLLGVYDAEATAAPDAEAVSEDGGLPALPPSQLLQGTRGSRVPYLRHSVYTRGAPCEVPGAGGKPRRAEVRVACSPDAAMHLTVHEPQACRYVVVLFTPMLRGVPEFQPKWEGAAKPWAGAGAAMSAEMLAQVAGALGLPGLQFSWVGEPQGGAQPAAGTGSEPAKHHGTATEKAEAVVSGSSGRVPTLLPGSGAAAGGAAPGPATQGGVGGGAGAGDQPAGGSQEAAAVPASDAGSAISAADPQQQAVDPESSDQSDL